MSLRLTVDPLRSLVDEPVNVRVTGARPGAQVTVRAKLTDDLKRTWESWAAFAADSAGTVDVSSQRPTAGTYQDPDPLGLFWSLTLDPREEPKWSIGLTTGPMVVTVSAASDGAVSSIEVERCLAGPGVARLPVRDDGMVATFFRPAGRGPLPAVIVLGGSSGGVPERNAALLASRGFAALALAYFRAEHLPKDLVDIPLEYFETAIRWLQKQESVNTDRLATLGSSRGGELALLLGATFPDIKAVVGYVPSGVGHGGIATAGTETTTVPRPAWTHRGNAIPFLSRGGGRPSTITSPPGEPFALTPIFLRMLEDRDAVEAAMIPVERINGPVLLVSGQDDAMWPSPVLADLAMQRLAQHRHPFPYTHLSYPGAGHLVGPPGLPGTFTASVHVLTRTLMAFGGTPKDNAAACMQSWSKVLAFLRESLG